MANKLERMRDMLHAESRERCDSFRDMIDTALVGGSLVVASVSDQGEPELEVYEGSFARAWYDLTMKYKRDEPDENLSYWLWESHAVLDGAEQSGELD